jgi:hypothetical protein
MPNIDIIRRNDSSPAGIVGQEGRAPRVCDSDYDMIFASPSPADRPSRLISRGFPVRVPLPIPFFPHNLSTVFLSHVGDAHVLAFRGLPSSVPYSCLNSSCLFNSLYLSSPYSIEKLNDFSSTAPMQVPTDCLGSQSLPSDMAFHKAVCQAVFILHFRKRSTFFGRAMTVMRTPAQVQ